MAYVYVIIAGVSWALIGLFTKAVTALGFTEMEMLFVKGAVSVIFLGGLLLLRDRKLFRLKKWTDLFYFIGTGIISFTFFSWSYMRAINLTGVGVAAVLLYTAPAIVMMLSVILFKESLTPRKCLVLLMTLVGCVFVTGALGAEVSITGEGLFAGLCAGVGYALYSIFGTFAVRRGYGSLTISFYTFLVATLFMGFWVAPVEVAQKITASGQWVLAISFALLTTVLPYLCYTKGLAGLPASRASVTATIEPVVAAILGIVVLHEPATVSKIAGILLVVGAIVVGSYLGKEEKKAEKTQVDD